MQHFDSLVVTLVEEEGREEAESVASEGLLCKIAFTAVGECSQAGERQINTRLKKKKLN